MCGLQLVREVVSLPLIGLNRVEHYCSIIYYYLVMGYSRLWSARAVRAFCACAHDRRTHAHTRTHYHGSECKSFEYAAVTVIHVDDSDH